MGDTEEKQVPTSRTALVAWLEICEGRAECAGNWVE